jgi:anthranilate/para-aminobenzoate synthase component I
MIIERYSHLMHIVSQVVGHLQEGRSPQIAAGSRNFTR